MEIVIEHRVKNRLYSRILKKEDNNAKFDINLSPGSFRQMEKYNQNYLLLYPIILGTRAMETAVSIATKLCTIVKTVK